MGHGELCLLLSVQCWGLWGGTNGQRPVWYQVGMEPAPGETPVQSQPSLGIAAGALGWPGLAYWSLALTLVLGALTIKILLPRWGHSPEKPQVTPRADGHGLTGSGNAALADVLHLLDAVMEKMGRRLQCRERRRPAQCCKDP